MQAFRMITKVAIFLQNTSHYRRTGAREEAAFRTSSNYSHCKLYLKMHHTNISKREKRKKTNAQTETLGSLMCEADRWVSLSDLPYSFKGCLGWGFPQALGHTLGGPTALPWGPKECKQAPASTNYPIQFFLLTETNATYKCKNAPLHWSLFLQPQTTATTLVLKKEVLLVLCFGRIVVYPCISD